MVEMGIFENKAIVYLQLTILQAVFMYLTFY